MNNRPLLSLIPAAVRVRIIELLRTADKGTAVGQSARASSLLGVTKAIGDDWKQSPYYDEAEQSIDHLWRDLIWPMIKDSNFESVIDLAAGHGRNSAKLLEHCHKLAIVDINRENIQFCKRRFGADERIQYFVTNGISLQPIADDSVSFLYSFDAMVHFDSDTVRAYIAEFRRVLRPGARGFCHHSNFVGNPSGDFRASPHWRNFMSKELFEHYCTKEGLRVLRAQVIDWGVDSAPKLDCITLFEKP